MAYYFAFYFSQCFKSLLNFRNIYIMEILPSLYALVENGWYMYNSQAMLFMTCKAILKFKIERCPNYTTKYLPQYQ